MTVRRRPLLAVSLVAALALGGLFLALRPARAGGTFTVTLLIVDAAGKPVPGAEASTMWNVREGPILAYNGVTTGPDGRAILTIDDWNEKRPVLILSADRNSGCVASASRAEAGQEVRAKLVPTARVSGSYTCSELRSQKPDNAITLVGADGFRLSACFIQSITKTGGFDFRLPNGKYELTMYATDTERKRRLITIDATNPVSDLGAIDLPAAKLAKLQGNPAPPLTVTEARGVDAKVTLANFKGKWVALEFWGWWCGPCVAGGIPEAVAFQKMYAEHADKFVILALHGSGAKTLAEMDAKLPRIRAQYWNGEELPFPILLDATEETAKRYGISGWPTTLLIDPEGKLVSDRGFTELAKKLPPVAAAKAWAACRDRPDNAAYGNDPKSPATFRALADWLQRETYCPVEIDDAALRAAGVDPAGPIPTPVVGGLYYWRDRVQLLLEPHGLGIAPSPDGKKLVITKCMPIAGPQSVAQQYTNDWVNATLDRNPLATLVQKVNSVAFADATLVEVARKLSREYGITIAFDRSIGTSAKVTGKLGPAYLRDGLSKLLDPLGLTFAVRSGAIVVGPKPQ